MSEPRQISAVGVGVQQSKGGTGLVPSKYQQPVWGRLTKKSNDADNYFEWEEVWPDRVGRWQSKDDLPNSRGLGSYYDSQTLLSPAVEVNGHSATVGDVVRLIPTRRITDENGNVHRAWLFAYHELRPFRLLDYLIPGFAVAPIGGVTDDDSLAWFDVIPLPIEAPDAYPAVAGVRETQWRHKRIRGRFIVRSEADVEQDEECEEAWFYPVHNNGFPQGDEFISLGLAWGRDEFGPGALGWAKWVPHATALGRNENDDIIWQGEWQIVRLETETIVQAWLTETTIQPNEMGFMDIVDVRRNAENVTMDGVLVNTPRNVVATACVFNDSPVPITQFSIHKIHFDKRLYIWRPVSPIASSHGMSIYADTGVNVPDANWVAIPFNVEIGGFGEAIQRNGSTIKNTGEVDVIGTVSWTVTARRRLTDVVGGLAGPDDVDSRLQCALFNNGVLVPGSKMEITSSRRIAVDEGKNAANTMGKSIIQTLDAGASLEVKARTLNQADADDYWTTKADEAAADDSDEMCTLTFVSNVSVYME